MTTAGSLDDYLAVTADVVRDRTSILALWSQGLSHRGMPESKFDWYYERNPEGPPLAVLLLHGPDQESVGVASAGRRRMRFGDETVLAGTLVDFVVVPRHRTLFPAILLQKKLRRRARESFGITFALPNSGASAAIGRAGYRVIGYMVRRACVLRSAGYLSRHLPAGASALIGTIIDCVRLGSVGLRTLVTPGFRAQWLDRPDSRFDELWERAVARDVLMGVRGSAFLSWRFVDCPLRAHSLLALFSTTDQRLVAYAACEKQAQTLHVRDFLVDPAEAGAWVRLWLDLYREAFHAGHAVISVEFLGSERIQRGLAAAGMVERERRPFYAAAADRWMGLMQGNSWYITCADEDW